eukprot:m.131363 g.131363  ORF g.131363 m.131363 type:complete len:246 (-) comp20017_c1_seq7:324-1061(-)
MAAADEKESQLDLSKSVNVWMIRVPNYLAERWDAVSAAGADVEIGTLRIFKKADGSKRPKIELRVSESLQAAGDHALPPVLEVQTTDDTPKGLNVISETKSGKYCVANEGEIALRGTCTCKDTALYSKLKKKKETQPRTLLPEVYAVPSFFRFLFRFLFPLPFPFSFSVFRFPFSFSVSGFREKLLPSRVSSVANMCTAIESCWPLPTSRQVAKKCTLPSAWPPRSCGTSCLSCFRRTSSTSWTT